MAHIDSEDLLVGDILFIEAGDILNVDGILYKSHDLIVSEEESASQKLKVEKNGTSGITTEKFTDSFLFAGSKVIFILFVFFIQ